MSFKRRPERRVRGFGLFQYRSRNGRGQKTSATFFRAGSARIRQNPRHGVFAAADVPGVLKKRPAPIAPDVASRPCARPGQCLRPSQEAVHPLQAAHRGCWHVPLAHARSRCPTGHFQLDRHVLQEPAWTRRNPGATPATRSPGAVCGCSRSAFDTAPPRRVPTRRPTGPSVGRS